MLEYAAFRRVCRPLLGVMVTLIVAGGCRHKPPGPLTGAATPRGAVQAFMNAVRAQDLQALGAVWGNSHGPARDAFDREQLERRELLLICYFNHEKFEIQSERKSDAAHESIEVEVSRGRLVRTTRFTVVKAKTERWYVEDADITVMQAFCESKAR